MITQRRAPRTARTPPIIHVVDDDPQVLQSVLRLLRVKGYDARGFLCPREFLLHCEAEDPGCVVLDIRMPVMTGLEVRDALAAAGRVPPIVFLTGHGDIASSVRAMRAGAVDFLTKPPDAQALLRAVAEALTLDERQRLTRSQAAPSIQRLSALTARERQVFRRVVEGQMNKQIAADLGISEKTVKVYRSQVMHKMGARTLAQLVHMHWALQASVEPHGAAAKPSLVDEIDGVCKQQVSGDSTLTADP